MYYQKKYHLNFIHAKKLFFFDLNLVLACFVLAFSAYIWFTYDPTVSRFVDITVQAETHNDTGIIRSGEHVSYVATVQNNADIALHDAVLSFQMPRGFVVQTGSVDTALDILEPGETQTVSIEGYLFESVDVEHHVSAVVRYRQENSQLPEQKIFTIIQNLRGSVVSSSISTPPSIILGTEFPVRIAVKNTDHHDAKNVIVPLTFDGIMFTPDNTATQTIRNNEWVLPLLNPNEEQILIGTARVEKNNLSTIRITPLITDPNNVRVTQRSAQSSFLIVTPSLRVTSQWNDTAPLTPGEERELTLTIKNTGQVPLERISVEIPLANTSMSVIRLTSENGGTIRNSVYSLNAPFTTLEPDSERTMVLRLDAPLRVDTGTNISLSPNPTIVSYMNGVPNTPIKTAVQVAPLPISSLVTLSAESRYYTDEGDQLGRGPLPPVVGEETKYWALITIHNTTNNINSVTFSATLPEHVVFTGRTSVSHGDLPLFSPSSRTISWSLPRLTARDSAGIYMELALTPTTGQRGTSPILLQNISMKATDGFTNVTIQKTAPAIDISIPKDEIGSQKGIHVQ